MARELWCGGADDGPLVIPFRLPDTRHPDVVAALLAHWHEVLSALRPSLD